VPKVTRLVWHYTTETHLNEILASRVLLLKAAGPTVLNERPGVWFSKEQIWEPTAQKARRNPRTGEEKLLGMRGTYENAGLGRIGVDAERTLLLDFDTFVATCEMPAKIVRAMKKWGQGQGANPRNWMCSLEPVGIEQWIAFGRYDGMHWRDVFYDENPRPSS
jgi:hypothetical protein